ncbi:TPA: SUMF1/EgtB/PvdO family nonheme iron enzyme [Vibrio cholerae]|nr:SUMF1/EgtB/PvdO family nonheme iron enzyme [Vibrio cholerae]
MSDFQALIESNRRLSGAVEAKVGEIDKKVSSSIASMESQVSRAILEMTASAVEGHKKAIEDASGGKNTIIVDDQGNPNVMVRIPRFNYEDLNAAIIAKYGVDLNLGSGTPTMFMSNGVLKNELYIGKYLASSGKNGGCAVVGGVQPRTSVSYDVAKNLCSKKGAGWHLMSIHEWAAIALWSLANGTVPRGNTNYGRSHENKLETAPRADGGIPGDASGTARTNSGAGPVTWSHDHTSFGIQDLVGNVWEWLDQMMLSNGQIIATNDNNPLASEAQWQRHQAFFDSTSASSAGTGNVGQPILSNEIVNRNGPIDDDSYNYPYTHNGHFAAIQKSADYKASELLRRLLIESASPDTVRGALWVRNYGLRFPLRGGHWNDGAHAGLGALGLHYARSYSNSSIGFRPAFFA